MGIVPTYIFKEVLKQKKESLKTTEIELNIQKEKVQNSWDEARREEKTRQEMDFTRKRLLFDIESLERLIKEYS